MPKDSSVPDIGDLANVEITYMAELNICSVTLSAKDMHYAAYSFVAQIVEELRAGNIVSKAIERSIDEHRLLLLRREILSEDKQVGLIGELLFLKYLLSLKSTPGMESWLGPLAEQHDFSFGQFDLEVKTTRGESRVHRIASVTQLEASPNRELWFLSIQITSAGVACKGFSLSSLIEEIRELLGENTRAFDDELKQIGCKDEDLHFYKKYYMLRSNPAFFLVDESFPRLLNEHLTHSVPNYEYISDISYRINVSHLTPRRGADIFNEFSNYTNRISGV
ncbi:PD-(D/E)XK motif protein [Glutamicibacter sp. AGC46]